MEVDAAALEWAEAPPEDADGFFGSGERSSRITLAKGANARWTRALRNRVVLLRVARPKVRNSATVLR
jgi:hypothetical protein